jgi:hypothetical protein
MHPPKMPRADYPAGHSAFAIGETHGELQGVKFLYLKLIIIQNIYLKIFMSVLFKAIN